MNIVVTYGKKLNSKLENKKAFFDSKKEAVQWAALLTTVDESYRIVDYNEIKE